MHLGNKENPYAVSPSYESWAPWVGPRTRKCSLVLNTEYEKVHTSPKVPVEDADLNVTESRLVDELLNQRVRNSMNALAYSHYNHEN